MYGLMNPWERKIPQATKKARRNISWHCNGIMEREVKLKGDFSIRSREAHNAEDVFT